MSITDYQHQENQKQRAALEAEGFKFEISPDGYKVQFKGAFIAAASVHLPRTKPLHRAHRAANIRDNLNSAVSIAHRNSNANQKGH